MSTAIISCGVAFTIKWCVDVQLCIVNVKIKFCIEISNSQCDPDELYMECDAQLCDVQFYIHTIICKLLLDYYKINLFMVETGLYFIFFTPPSIALK